MRIVVVYNYLPTHMGGIETALDALATEYVRRGHDVSVIGAEAPDLTVREKSTAYRTIGVPASNLLEQRAGVPYPIAHPRLLSVLAREVARADVICGHGFLCAPTLAAFGLARAHGSTGPIRLLVEHVGHVDYPSRFLDSVEALAIQTIGRATATLADGIVVYNTRVEEELRSLVPTKPIEWIANGVDQQRYHPASPDERTALRTALGWDDRPRVLFVGRLVAKKGIHLALEVAAKSNGAFEVVFVGPGGLSAPLPQHAQFLGPQSPERVAELYRAADAFLLPSHGEGFPLTAQEALASGLPVFLGEDPTYERYCAGAGTSLQQVPREATAIVARLTSLFQTPGAREQAARDGLTHVKRSFSWEHTVTAHEAFIEQLRRARTSRSPSLMESFR